VTFSTRTESHTRIFGSSTRLRRLPTWPHSFSRGLASSTSERSCRLLNPNIRLKIEGSHKGYSGSFFDKCRWIARAEHELLDGRWSRLDQGTRTYAEAHQALLKVGSGPTDVRRFCPKSGLPSFGLEAFNQFHLIMSSFRERRDRRDGCLKTRHRICGSLPQNHSTSR